MEVRVAADERVELRVDVGVRVGKAATAANSLSCWRGRGRGRGRINASSTGSGALPCGGVAPWQASDTRNRKQQSCRIIFYLGFLKEWWRLDFSPWPLRRLRRVWRRRRPPPPRPGFCAWISSAGTVLKSIPTLVHLVVLDVSFIT